MLVTLCMSCEVTQQIHSKSFIGQYAAKSDFPILSGAVNDFDNILSEEQEVALLDLIKKHKTYSKRVSFGPNMVIDH